MNFRAGELRNKITLQSPVAGDDGSGGAPVSWVDVRVEFAHIRPLSGNESFGGIGRQGDRVEAKAMYLVVIRARSDVTEKFRVIWDDRILNIKFVRLRAPRAHYLEMECEMGGAL